MTTNQQMFLLVGEELSSTRAAARAYVSVAGRSPGGGQ